jgi:hypothetical protein
LTSIELGGRTMGRYVLGHQGGAMAETGLTGCSILEAADLDAAVGMAGGCPIIADGGNADVYETIDVSS